MEIEDRRTTPVPAAFVSPNPAPTLMPVLAPVTVPAAIPLLLLLPVGVA